MAVRRGVHPKLPFFDVAPKCLKKLKTTTKNIKIWPKVLRNCTVGEDNIFYAVDRYDNVIIIVGIIIHHHTHHNHHHHRHYHRRRRHRYHYPSMSEKKVQVNVYLICSSKEDEGGADLLVLDRAGNICPNFKGKLIISIYRVFQKNSVVLIHCSSALA